jgi:hypothetical protein
MKRFRGFTFVLVVLTSLTAFAAEEKKEEKPKEIKAGPPDGSHCVDPFGKEGESRWSDGLKGWACKSPFGTLSSGAGRGTVADRYVVQNTSYRRLDAAYQIAPAVIAPLRMSLLSQRQFYVTAEGGGGANMTCNRREVGDWETFEVIDRNGSNLTSGDAIQLRAPGGQYIAPDISANAANTSAAETFIIVKLGGSSGTIVVPGDTFALRSAAGKYLTAEGGGGRGLSCNRTEIGQWETFRYVAGK